MTSHAPDQRNGLQLKMPRKSSPGDDDPRNAERRRVVSGATRLDARTLATILRAEIGPQLSADANGSGHADVGLTSAKIARPDGPFSNS
jgi:hypothetical protein